MADKICPKCSEKVFFAEEALAGGKAYHKKCFTCTTCGKTLDSMALSEREGQIYCKTCYGREFGPKGFGFGAGAGALSTLGKDELPAKKEVVAVAQIGWCTSCNGEKDGKFCGDCGGKLTVKALVQQTGWCNTCNAARDGKFCGDCGGRIDAKSAIEEKQQDAVDDTPIIKKAEAAPRKVLESVEKQQLPLALKPKGTFGGGVKCSRCAKTVYDAERKNGPSGLIFHDKCFTCKSCSKTLSAIDLTEHEKDIYCKACYGKNFGPKGYGYGVGAGALAYTQ
jgi:hypothetical protein